MCGRFVSVTPSGEIARYFGAELGERELPPSYNVAPGREVHALVARDGRRVLTVQRWGLVPFWARDARIGNKLINARAETLANRNAFRHALRRRRCVIPADGFYEWAAVPGRRRKQPYYIARRDGAPMAFAGLWERWQDPSAPGAAPLETCTVITGPANEAIAPIHDRMPVALDGDRWEAWLDPATEDAEALAATLVALPADAVTAHPVGTAVNRTSNDGPHLVEPEREGTAAPDAEAGRDQTTLW